MATDADIQASRLLTQAERLARLQDSLSRSFARELAAVLSDLQRSIRQWVNAGTLTGEIRAARAAALRTQLLDLLRAAGFDRLIDDASTAATDRLLATLDAPEAAKVLRFATRDLARVEALRSAFLEAVVPQDEELLIPLWRTVVQAIYSGRSRADLVEDLMDAVDRTKGEIETLYDTGVSVFTRQVQAIRAPEGDDALFLYAGPADVRLRPFCRERVGKVFTRGEIDAMDNGQLPNVFITAGGYRCRHTLQAVPKDSALVELHATGERVESVSRDLEFAGRALRSRKLAA